MKAVLIFLLAGVLFVQPNGSLRCYTCNTQFNIDNCKTAVICKEQARACKTDVINTVGFLNIISKECVSSCNMYYKDFFLGKRNISCCSTDLCNAGGISAFRPNCTQMVMVVFISFACIILGSVL
ncbi:prostate stem cell antigen-like [Python bivittatus]|uniref:Prostate stem cell antigen-like n=1 Tax=Python bivittatus TaxID=176946 RepID=A0A9F5IQ72_PYTBI|nr:prostate stem cell antigen-like [Python bivittatus]